MTALPSGFTDVLVVKNRTAAQQSAIRNLAFGWKVKGGGSVSANAVGGFDVRNRFGERILGSVAPRMWDSSGTAQRSGTSTDQLAKVAVGEFGPVRPGHDRRRGPVEGDRAATMPITVSSAGIWLAPVASTSLSSPTVTLYPSNAMPNRVDATGDGAPALNHYRLGAIDNGIGGDVSISYTKPGPSPSCQAGDTPWTSEASLAANTRLCYPSYYTKPGASSPTLNWFHKYVVTQVASSDDVTGSAQTDTRYRYVGGGAWRFDRSEFTPKKYRTWGQWRGFGKVQTFTGGDQGPWTASETLFMRGMNGDCLVKDCSEKKSVQVEDSRGGSLTDTDDYNGFARENLTYNGATLTITGGELTAVSLGKKLTESLDTPGLSSVHADNGTDQARTRWTTSTSARVYKADGTTFNETRSSTTYDSDGFATAENDEGDLAVTGDETCTRTTYASNTTLWIKGLVTSTQQVAKPCSATPDLTTDLIASARTWYDNATSWSATPTITRGLVTGSQAVSKVTGTASSPTLTWSTKSTTVYDAYGRVTSATEPGQSAATTTAYGVDSGGLLTSVTITTPPTTNAPNGLKTIRVLDPARGVPTSVTDPGSRKTTMAYDALGRLIDVWLPSQSTSGKAAKHFTYTWGSATTPTVVASGSLLSNGNYATEYTYYDGQLRAVQSQSSAADGSGARIVTESLFDGRGLQRATRGPVKVDGAPGANLVAVQDAWVPSRTDVEYDGAGRPVKSTLHVGTGSAAWRDIVTRTSYDGLSTTIVPPSGGAARKTTTDVSGNPTTITEYITASGTSGASQDTTFKYRADGLLTSMKDAAGNVWTREYDTMGRLSRSVDPDSGAQSMTYDSGGRLASTTDARGTVSFTYDALGRKTAETVDGKKSASWTYDTLVPGQLTSSTRYVETSSGTFSEYTRTITGYDKLYNVTGTTLSIPSSEGGCSGARRSRRQRGTTPSA